MSTVPEEVAMAVPRPRSDRLGLVTCGCGQMFAGPDRAGLYERHWLRNHAEPDQPTEEEVNANG